MFHLQSLELLHWDYCQRLTLPLDGSIITVAGPNGSGKTTLLDAMRTLLGLDCSGGRNYKTYARHANADSAWLRATVDNRPRNRQSSNRPFARCLLYSDVVTLVCRIDRNGGDWTRRYLMVEGDVSIEQLIERQDKDWLGIDNWRKRLEGAGLSRAIAKVLALEQGQTDRLCEYSPKELLKLVFDVFGDQDVLDRYDEARNHQRQLTQEVEAAERELAHGKAQRAELEIRVNSYRQYELKCQERETLATEVVPVLSSHETRRVLASKLRELHRQRLQSQEDSRQHAQVKAELLQRLQDQTDAATSVEELEAQVRTARRLQEEASDAERPVEALVKRADELQGLAVSKATPTSSPPASPSSANTSKSSPPSGNASRTSVTMPSAPTTPSKVSARLRRRPKSPASPAPWRKPASPTTSSPTSSRSATRNGAPPPKACCVAAAGSWCWPSPGTKHRPWPWQRKSASATTSSPTPKTRPPSPIPTACWPS